MIGRIAGRLRARLGRVWASFARVMGLIWRASPRLTVATFGIVLIQSILPALGLVALRSLLDLLGTLLTVAPDALLTVNGTLSGPILSAILLLGILLLLPMLLRSAAALISARHGQALARMIQERIQSHAILLDLAYFEDARNHNTLYRAQSYGLSAPQRILQSLVALLTSGLSAISLLVLLVTVSPALTVIIGLIALPALYLRAVQTRRIQQQRRTMTGIERQSGYYNTLILDPFAAREVRLFNLGGLFIERFTSLRKRIDDQQLSFARQQAISELIVQTLLTMLTIIALGVMAVGVVARALTIGQLVIYYQALQRVQGFMQDILTSVISFYEGLLYVADLFAFVDQPSQISAPANPLPVPKTITTGLQLENVSFRYPGTETPILNGITMTIPAGKIIALVGLNGAGKTTLIKLLCRLYDPTEGRILLDGVDIRQFDPIAYRAVLTMVFQDFLRYEATVAENIWYGDIGQPPDEPKISAAAQKAGIMGKVGRWKKGIQTPLGRWLAEGGEELSIGEWQKIALARAAFREAQIVMLDEPSSALDAQSEYEIFSNLRALFPTQAVVLISHRQSTIRLADYVVVLEGGQVAEAGTPVALVERGGVYTGLFTAQSALL